MPRTVGKSAFELLTCATHAAVQVGTDVFTAHLVNVIGPAVVVGDPPLDLGAVPRRRRGITRNVFNFGHRVRNKSTAARGSGKTPTSTQRVVVADLTSELNTLGLSPCLYSSDMKSTGAIVKTNRGESNQIAE